MFIKLNRKLLLSVSAVFFFAAANVCAQAVNVSSYTGLAYAVSPSVRATSVTFTTAAVNYTSALDTINYGTEPNPVVFYGNGVTLGGGGIYRLFNFSNANVLFQGNINFTDGNGTTYGGAIYNDYSIMTFISGDIIFTVNKATNPYGSGGAIYNINSTMTFTSGNIIFNGNEASLSTGQSGSGGAIHNRDSLINFEMSSGDTVIFGNNTASWGGAISNINSTMSFKNGNIEFVGNIGGNYYDIAGPPGGGAIYNHNSLINFEMSSADTIIFKDNTTNNSGGAIENYYNSQMDFKITSGSAIIFSSNTARYGGAISNTDNSTMTFTNGDIIFIENMGDGLGGAISNINSTMTFTNADIIFSGNSAVNYTYIYGYGGAIYNENSTMAFTSGNIAFNGNTANYGGAIHNSTNGQTIFINTDIIFSGNSTASGFGGAIFNIVYSTVSFIDGNIIFSGNSSAVNGGAIFNGYGSKIIFTNVNVIFSENNAQSNGGAIVNSDYYGFDSGFIDFINSEVTFYGNIAGMYGDGGAIYNTGSVINFTDTIVKFENNKPSGNTYRSGGAIYNENSTMTFTNGNVLFSNNMANYGGGAIYNINNSRINFEMSSGDTVIFSSNKAAIFNDSNSIMTFRNGDIIFSENINGTIVNGAQINFEMSSGDTVIFSSNTAGVGGALLNTNGSITFTNGNIIFSSNTANEMYGAGGGGAIYNYNGSKISFAGSAVIFSGNAAIDFGGAIYNENSLISFTDNNIMFNGNSVYIGYGGAIYNDNASTVIFTDADVKFIENAAGVYLYTDGYGGAICNSGGSTIASIDSAIIFGGNTASWGGAICNINDAIITFTNSDVMFVENKACDGGAIYNGYTMNFASSLVNFINNIADAGGAICASYGSNTNFSGGEINFINNEAVAYGGALYISDGTVLFNTDGGEVIFRGNKANGQANDAYMTNGAKLGISGSNAIRFEGGILTDTSGTGIEISKSGSGAMYLGGTNKIWGDFNITEGGIIMLADASYEGKALELKGTSTLNMYNGTVNTVSVGNFKSITNLSMDVFCDGTNDEIKAVTASIYGSIDIFAGVGRYDQQEYKLIITGGTAYLDGTFSSSSIISALGGGYLDYKLEYEDGIVKLILDGISTTNFGAIRPLTYNQSETAKAFKKISEDSGAWHDVLNAMVIKQNKGTETDIAEVKDFLAGTSGYFLANVIRNMAADSPNNEVYDKIRNNKRQLQINDKGKEEDTNGGLWVQVKGGIESFKEDENSLEDYKDVSMGVMLGFDRFIQREYGGDLIWGIYGRINKDNAEQGKHKADGNKNGLGLYGGYLRDGWELKAMLLGSYDKFNTERAVIGHTAKAEINAVTISADIEAALRIGISETTDFRPFAGIETQNAMYGGFKEKEAGIYNLDVKAGSYLRSAARIGAGLEYGKGRWIWHANAEGKYIIAGTKPEVKSEFEKTGAEFYSRGAQEGAIQIGVGLGAAVRIAEKWRMFVNGNYYGADKYRNIYGNTGVRYIISGSIRDEAKLREAKLQKSNLQAEREAKRIQKKLNAETQTQAKAVEKARIKEEKASAEKARFDAQQKKKLEKTNARKVIEEEAEAAALVKKRMQEAERQTALKAKREAKASELAKKQAEADEKARIAKKEEKAKLQAKLLAKRKAEEEAEAKKRTEEARRKADEKAKAIKSARKQAEEAEKARIARETAELKAKQSAEEKMRREEERVQRQKEKENAAAKKAVEKAEKQRLKKEAAEKAEYEAAQKAAAADLAVKEKESKEPVQKVSSSESAGLPETAVDVSVKEISQPETAENPEPAASAAKTETVKLSYVFPQTILFAGGNQFDLAPDGVREVWRAAEAIKEYMEKNHNEKFKVVVEGYTDSGGGEEINKQYSLKRAAAVANELADSDIDFEIIEPKGMGAVNFINKNNTLSVENRRVELKLIEIR